MKEHKTRLSFAWLPDYGCIYKVYLDYKQLGNKINKYKKKMHFNRKRHFILKKLVEKRNTKIDVRNARIDANEIGLSLDEIDRFLKVTSTERELILSELYKNDEIISFSLSVNGCFINENGVSSFSNKKYLKKNEDIIINWFKLFVQIVIPVLALLVAVLSLTAKFTILKMQSDKELQEIKYVMKEQKKRIEELEKKTGAHPYHKKNNSK
ncbi:conserved hypothetical protein [Flavobacterium sp. 9R]|uniref:hypothetical protein n=1 Tax=Flavobacterium sp. 9R TaxID=2653143 RepID=UPI0012F0ADD9|nr:hypothetical protein [Flavobacterium sp. 9R]VXB23336.1 conserved hypothetical protein [Flavobacterium sp. 9R]